MIQEMTYRLKGSRTGKVYFLGLTKNGCIRNLNDVIQPEFNKEKRKLEPIFIERLKAGKWHRLEQNTRRSAYESKWYKKVSLQILSQIVDLLEYPQNKKIKENDNL
ncbi:hypothetical protein GQR36_00385 [Enterococcus termitis]